MRISLTRQLKVNLGNYESYSFGATVTVDIGDVGTPEQDWPLLSPEDQNAQRIEMHDLAEEWLDRLLIADIESAQGITEEDRSVVLRSFTRQQPEPTPARSAHARTAKRPASRR